MSRLTTTAFLEFFIARKIERIFFDKLLNGIKIFLVKADYHTTVYFRRVIRDVVRHTPTIPHIPENQFPANPTLRLSDVEEFLAHHPTFLKSRLGVTRLYRQKYLPLDTAKSNTSKKTLKRSIFLKE